MVTFDSKLQTALSKGTAQLGFLRKTIDENFPKLRGVPNNVSFRCFDFSFEYILR